MWYCNRFREGEIVEYTQAIVRKYGQAKLDMLLAKKHFQSKMGDFEANQLIEHYKNLVKALKNAKK